MPPVDREPPIWLIDNVFGFETSLNEGASVWLWPGLDDLVCRSVHCGGPRYRQLAVLVWSSPRPLAHVRLGLVTAGIFGNLYDRIGLPGLQWAVGVPDRTAGERIYAVRDWLHFKLDALNFDYPIFNLADSFIVCGAVLLVCHAFLAQRDASAAE